MDRLDVPCDLLGIDDAVRVAERERLDILAAAEQVRVEQQNLQTAMGDITRRFRSTSTTTSTATPSPPTSNGPA